MELIDFKKYNEFLKEIITEINSARYKAHVSINVEHITSNFNLGRIIVEKQKQNSWGKSIVQKLSTDINKITDGLKGYSSQNLWYMRQFYLEYKEKSELLELSKQIPWSHNLIILSKTKSDEEKFYYLSATKSMGWSRNVLLNQILANAYEIQKNIPKQSNYLKTLPEHFAEQANESLKSVYNLDFLGITKPILERKMENRLIQKIKDFIMELGYGFCFIDNQYKIKLGIKEYYIDLLFYHRFLKCLIAVELKTVEFEPEFAGKMNFYLEILDEQEKQPDDNPSIGIILCPEKDHLEVEYALRIQNKPIGVAEYTLTNQLPESLKGKLPSIKELETEILIELEAEST